MKRRGLIPLKTCIRCGAELPEDANLCLNCGTPQSDPHPIRPYRPWRRRAFFLLLACALLLALLFLPRSVHLPKTYDISAPELTYSDSDRQYFLYLTWPVTRSALSEPTGSAHLQLPKGNEQAIPSLLYVRDPDTGENLADDLLQKLAHINVHAEAHEASEKLSISSPFRAESLNDAALAADIEVRSSSGTNDIIWTLEMLNGDRITLRHSLTVDPLLNVTYSSKEVALDTMDDLRALLDTISADDLNKTVTVYLPAVNYEGDLTIRDRGLELVGTSENGHQTTIHGHLVFESREIQYPVLRNISITGQDGVGITSSTTLQLEQCSVQGWDIGVLAREGAWVGIHNSLFENNRIGFQFDSSTASSADVEYSGNRFLNNETAVSLIHVPGSMELSFPKTLFSGNDTDISNPNDCPVDTQNTVFK